uniref:Uncharacterized protein n=1 Tax=Solanum lycopersicum TaxID=4081 RepID=K4AWQ2_SOLLC
MKKISSNVKRSLIIQVNILISDSHITLQLG